MKRVAIMQPYFFPYAGYFRLFAGVDQFVILDTVQFRRRGRIHRTEVPGPRGAIEWLTLPMARQSVDTRIEDMAFSADARQILDARLERLPWLKSDTGRCAQEIRDHLYAPLESPVDFLERGLRLVIAQLSLNVPITRSSDLNIESGPGQDRVLAILKRLGATHYLNAPGGRSLYSADDFASAGIALEFLAPYGGKFRHLLHALMTYPVDEIRRDVLEQTSIGGSTA